MSKPDLSSIGVPTVISLYDSFEIEPCQEIKKGTIAVVSSEPIEGLPVFWTVYGRLPEGEVEALVDVTDEASALAVQTLLEMLHDGACRKESFRR